MEEKKLYRNTEDAVLCGVCSGIAEYFNIDVTLVRLITFLCCFHFGLIFYIAAALIIPAKPQDMQDM